MIFVIPVIFLIGSIGMICSDDGPAMRWAGVLMTILHAGFLWSLL
jgi:hypothetical protein